MEDRRLCNGELLKSQTKNRRSPLHRPSGAAGVFLLRYYVQPGALVLAFIEGCLMIVAKRACTGIFPDYFLCNK